MTSNITKNEYVIFNLSTGSKIKALKDLHEDLDPSLPCWFTANECYVVESVHPVADPPFVKVKTNDGVLTKLNAEHIQADFCVV